MSAAAAEALDARMEILEDRAHSVAPWDAMAEAELARFWDDRAMRLAERRRAAA